MDSKSKKILKKIFWIMFWIFWILIGIVLVTLVFKIYWDIKHPDISKISASAEPPTIITMIILASVFSVGIVIFFGMALLFLIIYGIITLVILLINWLIKRKQRK